MFTSVQINSYMDAVIKHDFKGSFVDRLSKAKGLIDRENLNVTDFLINASLKEYVHKSIVGNIVTNKYNKPELYAGKMSYIWGFRIHYLVDVPNDVGILLSLNDNKELINNGIIIFSI